MEAAKSLLIVVWNWISANRDALILEAISIAVTVGLIEAVLRRRERRKWSPTRRQGALDVGWTLQQALMHIMDVSGLTLSDVLPHGFWMTQATDPARGLQRMQAEFFEQQYEGDFETKYQNTLRQVGREEWARFSNGMGYALTDLDRVIDLASGLFGAEVMTALLELRERVRMAGLALIFYETQADASERDFRWIQELASKIGRALTLLWDNVN